MRLKLEWTESTLPRCFGWPCFKAEHAGHVARIWQGSPHTTREEWIYSIDGGPITIIRGNRGSAKAAASQALLRLVKATKAAQ